MTELMTEIVNIEKRIEKIIDAYGSDDMYTCSENLYKGVVNLHDYLMDKYGDGEVEKSRMWIEKVVNEIFCECCGGLIPINQNVYIINYRENEKKTAAYCCLECFGKEDLSGMKFQEVKRHE